MNSWTKYYHLKKKNLKVSMNKSCTFILFSHCENEPMPLQTHSAISRIVYMFYWGKCNFLFSMNIKLQPFLITALRETFKYHLRPSGKCFTIHISCFSHCFFWNSSLQMMPKFMFQKIILRIIVFMSCKICLRC